jgi:hypothetical protein
MTADEVVHLTLACKNIDRDRNGWYALRIVNGLEVVGRGSTAWEAVRQAHHVPLRERLCTPVSVGEAAALLS